MRVSARFILCSDVCPLQHSLSLRTVTRPVEKTLTISILLEVCPSCPSTNPRPTSAHEDPLPYTVLTAVPLLQHQNACGLPTCAEGKLHGLIHIPWQGDWVLAPQSSTPRSTQSNYLSWVHRPKDMHSTTTCCHPAMGARRCRVLCLLLI